jgi:tRNA-dihydrouridine synthase
MRDPALAGRIVAAMHAATPLPITVKTRLGPRPDKVAVFELLDAVAAAGGAALTVHARFATQEHSGEVRLDLLAEVKRRSRIPVIGNGGVRRAGDIEAMFRETGVDAVMVAQAALGNPWIFQEAHFMKCDPEAGAKRDLDELRRVLQEHVDGTLELCRQIRSRHRLPARALPPEDAAAVTFRCQLFRYLRGLKGANYVRGRLHELRTLADIQRAVEGCLEREARYRALRLTPPERLTTMPAS